LEKAKGIIFRYTEKMKRDWEGQELKEVRVDAGT
jgi:hypothetical protein